MVLAVDDDGIANGTTKPLVVLGWASRKLTRVCRSSLAAEAQAACVAVDELKWAKISILLILHPVKKADDEELCRALGASPVVTDESALYGTSRTESAGLGFAEENGDRAEDLGRAHGGLGGSVEVGELAADRGRTYED